MATPTGKRDGLTSTSLFQRASAGERDAWMRLADLYAPIAYHWCRQAGLRPVDAAKTVQQVFQSMVSELRRLDRAAEGASFHGWLRTVTRTRLVDHFRQIAESSKQMGEAAKEHQWRQAVEEAMRLSDGRVADECHHERICEALETVGAEANETTWRAIVRTVFHEQSPAEVASEMRIHVASVHQARWRMLVRIHRILESQRAAVGGRS